MIPRLMLGTSPFIGAGQFGSRSVEYRRTFYDNPKNMEKMFISASRAGINAVQLIAYEPVIQALRKAEKEAGPFFKVVTIVDDVKKCLDSISILDPEYAAPHAMYCDRNDGRLPYWIDLIKDTGARPAASTHNPGITIPNLDHLDFEAFLSPLNPVGYLMKPDFDSTIRAVKRTNAQVIAIKPLASGTLIPDVGLFRYIFTYADSMAVGMTSEQEMGEIVSILAEMEA